MIVANRATLSGISEHPFFSLRAGFMATFMTISALSYHLHHWALVGWRRILPRMRVQGRHCCAPKTNGCYQRRRGNGACGQLPSRGRVRALPGALSEKAELRLLCEQHRWRSRAALCNRALANHDLLLELLRLC